MADLNIAEIPHASGQVRYRYSRYLSEDGTRWIRHGLFREYHENGAIISEGNYEHGVEHGLWRDYYPNGKLAAEGQYDKGIECGRWRYWNADGSVSE
ncbi:MAG: hypothetical protein HYS18_11505 [Burkholderiales bacterium]|nr:hypothetical protein [Burkholderiales bacterium]